MKSLSVLTLAGSLLIGGFLVSAQADGDTEPDPTSQETWSAGTASGQGNFESYCMPCHGATGKGDGVLSDSLDAKPRDLSDPAFTGTKTDDHLFKVVKDGGASVGLTENMTPFSGQLSDEEIKNVVAYLRQEICKCTYEGE
jgi:mono/diheme cytochrome c family protein